MENKNGYILAFLSGALVTAVIFTAVNYNKKTDSDKKIIPPSVDKSTKEEPKAEFGGVGGVGMQRHGGGGGFHGGGGRHFGIPYAYGYGYPYYYNPDALCEFIDKSGKRIIRSCDPNVATILDN